MTVAPPSRCTPTKSVWINFSSVIERLEQHIHSSKIWKASWGGGARRKLGRGEGGKDPSYLKTQRTQFKITKNKNYRYNISMYKLWYKFLGTSSHTSPNSLGSLYPLQLGHEAHLLGLSDFVIWYNFIFRSPAQRGTLFNLSVKYFL